MTKKLITPTSVGATTQLHDKVLPRRPREHREPCAQGMEVKVLEKEILDGYITKEHWFIAEPVGRFEDKLYCSDIGVCGS